MYKIMHYLWNFKIGKEITITTKNHTIKNEKGWNVNQLVKNLLIYLLFKKKYKWRFWVNRKLLLRETSKEKLNFEKLHSRDAEKH